jgi:predicted MFS family arabinose efflux permease
MVAPTWRFWQRFSDPRLMAKLALPRIVVAFGAGLIFPFLNLFYKERFGVSDATLGWVFGITSVFAALMMFASGILAERWGTIRAMLVARTISTPMMLMIGFVPSFPIVVAAHWIRSGLMRLGEPLYTAFAMEQLDESERATGSGLMRMSWDVGWSVGPALSGVVQVHAGFSPLFVATTAFYGLSLLLVYRFFWRGKKIKVQSLERDGAFGTDAGP